MAPERPAAILIVEDERLVALDLQQTLQEFGYDASAIASSADEALRLAEARAPDLVLMDIRINGPRDGVETARLLKTACDVPVVYLTAHADAGTLDRAKETEPHGYLVKPVRAAELRSMVEVSLHKHRADVGLRERERWFATTLQSITDAVVTVGLDGRVTFMNPAAEALTGCAAVAALGTPVDDVVRLERAAADGGASTSPILDALRTGAPVALAEARLTSRADGVVRIVADSAAPVIDQQRQRVLGAVMVFRDITAERELQEQLERADRLASLGTMAAGLAHEVSNPLTVVLGNAEFMSEELDELGSSLAAQGEAGAHAAERCAVLTDALKDVRAAALRIERIVSDIRTFARPAAPMRGQVDVVRCVEWAVRATSHEFRTRARLVRALAAVPPVEGDEARLGQVLINLLMNAAQAIPPGASDSHAVTVTTGLDHDGAVLLDVQDTGAGIPDDVIGHVFEPFFTTKPVGEGTGLGLSISHGIIRAMGGTLRIESAPGHGTTVRMRLPVAIAPGADAPPSTAPAEAPARLNVLLVDDEPALLAVFKRVLKAHAVTCVEGAAAALALVDGGQPFDVIVTDLTMPDLSGMDLYRHLAARHPALVGRVVFMSGGAFTPEVEAFLRSVPNARLSKPLESRQLVAAVLEAGRGRGPAPPP